MDRRTPAQHRPMLEPFGDDIVREQLKRRASTTVGELVVDQKFEKIHNTSDMRQEHIGNLGEAMQMIT